MLPPFRKESVFYPLAINYLVSRHGFIEIFSRYFYLKTLRAKERGHSLQDTVRGIVGEEGDFPEYNAYISEIFNNNMLATKYLTEASLPSLADANIKLDPDELAWEIGSTIDWRVIEASTTSSTFLITVFEILPEAIKYNKKDEVVNFLYHCRNAAAHNGHFNIYGKGKERFPAKWRNFEIIVEMEGTALFRTNKPGLISVADILYLVYDISEIYQL